MTPAPNEEPVVLASKRGEGLLAFDGAAVADEEGPPLEGPNKLDPPVDAVNRPPKPLEVDGAAVVDEEGPPKPDEGAVEGSEAPKPEEGFWGPNNPPVGAANRLPPKPLEVDGAAAEEPPKDEEGASEGVLVRNTLISPVGTPKPPNPR